MCHALSSDPIICMSGGQKKQNRIKGTTSAVLCDFSFLQVSQLTSQQRCNLQKARAEEEKIKDGDKGGKMVGKTWTS